MHLLYKTTEMACLWTLFSNHPKWFQLFVYFFSKKKNFLERLPQLILSFLECAKVIFAIFENFY